MLPSDDDRRRSTLRSEHDPHCLLCRILNPHFSVDRLRSLSWEHLLLLSHFDLFSLPPLLKQFFPRLLPPFCRSLCFIADHCIVLLRKIPGRLQLGCDPCESERQCSVLFICFSSPPSSVGHIMQLCPFSLSFFFSSSCLTGSPVLLMSVNSSLNFSCRTLYFLYLSARFSHSQDKKNALQVFRGLKEPACRLFCPSWGSAGWTGLPFSAILQQSSLPVVKF